MHAHQKIAIIGGGAGGIVAAKSVLEEGLTCDVFESASTVGGVWRPDGLAWPNMRVNISRFTGVFSDFLWEQAFPDSVIQPYPTTQEMHAYLLAYVKHFKLEPYIHTMRRVTRVTKNANDWTVCWREGNTVSQENYSGVILAAGRYQTPTIPPFAGLELFKGEKIHSAAYRSAEQFKNKSVLVVGGSLSSVAIVGELTGSVTHLIRRPRWITPTQLFLTESNSKIPGDLFYSRTTYQARTFAWYMKHCGKQNAFSEWEMKPDTPAGRNVVSDVYVEKLQQGFINVISSEIDSFSQSSVKLKNGRTLTPDAVIFCTGYEYDFSYLDAELATEIKKSFLCYEDTFHPNIPGMAFIGMNYQSRGAIFPLVELQARFASAVFSQRLALPSSQQMQAAIAAMPATRDGFTFATALAKQLAILDFEKLSQDDANLHKLIMNGAIIPAHYRIHGVGSNMTLAKQAILLTEHFRQSCFNRKKFFTQPDSETKTEITCSNQKFSSPVLSHL